MQEQSNNNIVDCVEIALDVTRTLPALCTALKGGGIIAEQVLKEVPLQTGNISSYLAENVQGSAYDFDSGGKVIHTQDQVQKWVTSKMTKFLQADVLRACITYEPLSKPQDVFIQQQLATESRILCVGDEVYTILTNEDSKDHALMQKMTFVEISWLALCAVMVELPVAPTFPVGITTLTKDQLLQLGKNPLHLLFCAYDGESFIIWSR